MTWSIIARDEPTGRIGIAVATRFFAVGALVPHIRTGAGGVASQAFMNPYYGPKGLALLEAGVSAEDVIARLTAADEGRDNRQLHVMDRVGRFAAYTGAACIGWCGHEVRANYSIAGNMLTSPQVLAQTMRVYESRSTLPFARRLIAAMLAGEEAGGRQARQAVGGTPNPRRRGLPPLRSARRRPRRPARRDCAAGGGRPPALGAFPPLDAEPERTFRADRSRQARDADHQLDRGGI